VTLFVTVTRLFGKDASNIDSNLVIFFLFTQTTLILSDALRLRIHTSELNLKISSKSLSLLTINFPRVIAHGLLFLLNMPFGPAAGRGSQATDR
jgi:uncharacterized membrane protein